MRRRSFLSALAAAPMARAQGFAGLGTQAGGFAPVAPGRVFAFPADHGSHPGFRVEWWYLTLLLDAADARRFGAQFTLFRTAMRPGPEAQGWDSRIIWLGHAALTSARRHLSAERLARGGLGLAGARAAPFRAWMDHWRLEGTSDALSLDVAAEDFAIRLRAARPGPVVLQGDRGYSVKSHRGHASYYYSMPFIEGVAGEIDAGDGPIPVTGRGWLDREWSSQPLSGAQSGWDWFGLHLAGGEKLTLFRLRQGDAADFLSATLFDARGAGRAIDDFALTSRAMTLMNGREIPTSWKLSCPSLGVEGALSPLNPRAYNAFATPYWEGPVALDGPRPAEGYMELTGY